MDSLLRAVMSLPPAQWCQAYFAIASALIIGVNILPADMRKSLMDYGARRPSGDGKDGKDSGSTSAAARFVACVMDHAQVPHAWFLHFYIVSVGWSLFWGWQYVSRGAVLRELALAQDRAGEPTMEISQVFVAWLLMTLQSVRRLYESLFVSKMGSSPMSFVHWALGVTYYSAMCLSVWVEGSGAILESWEHDEIPRHLPPRVPIAVGLFFIGFLKQYESHVHLASLKKYTLPSMGWFQYIICPHYTAECLIYLGLVLGTAPPGKSINTTMLSGLVFVMVNLGATAHGTKQWYAQKFGADKVATRWKMIPMLY